MLSKGIREILERINIASKNIYVYIYIYMIYVYDH